jgi:Antitoxin MazE-like
MSTSSKERVRRHRAKLRRQGMKPITIWVPDVRSDEFVREAHRQSLLIAGSPADEEEQAWVDEASMWADE